MKGNDHLIKLMKPILKEKDKEFTIAELSRGKNRDRIRKYCYYLEQQGILKKIITRPIKFKLNVDDICTEKEWHKHISSLKEIEDELDNNIIYTIDNDKIIKRHRIL